ncbi:hypothetical protein LINPERHAP2_LOCUS8267 [Linum perenne]
MCSMIRKNMSYDKEITGYISKRSIKKLKGDHCRG